MRRSDDSYIGKVCYLLLVQADYIGPRISVSGSDSNVLEAQLKTVQEGPGCGPDGIGNCSSCYGVTVPVTVIFTVAGGGYQRRATALDA